MVVSALHYEDGEGKQNRKKNNTNKNVPKCTIYTLWEALGGVPSWMQSQNEELKRTTQCPHGSLAVNVQQSTRT